MSERPSGTWTATITRSKAIPLINVKLIEGVFSQEQKREMIAKLTDTMVEIEGEKRSVR